MKFQLLIVLIFLCSSCDRIHEKKVENTANTVTPTAQGNEHSNNVILIRSNLLKMKVDDVPIHQIFKMDKEFSGLQPLGEPKKRHFEDRYSELYWEFSYENLRLIYVDFGDGPYLFEMQVLLPGRDVQINNISIKAVKSVTDALLGNHPGEIVQLEPDTTAYNKFGDFLEYVEIFTDDEGNAVKVIFGHDPQI